MTACNLDNNSTQKNATVSTPKHVLFFLGDGMGITTLTAARKLDRHLLCAELTPLARVQAFVDDAQAGMARYDYRRGCLIGNLGQEMGALPESFRAQLQAVFADWQARLAACLRLAQQAGEMSATADAEQLAAFFWIGWEGAVLRAKLAQSAEPLTLPSGKAASSSVCTLAR
jgi:hypothetical protein